MTPLDLDAIRERLPGYDWKASHRDTERALLSIIDLQTRALLDVEWRSTYAHCQCPSCGAPGPAPYPHLFIGHVRGCPLDAAFTACGLDTQEKRDAARKAGR